MLELHLIGVLGLWAVSHCSAEFFAERGYDSKPYNCQKCSAGWVAMALAIIQLTRWIAYSIDDGLSVFYPLAWWGASIIIEAVYERIQWVEIK